MQRTISRDYEKLKSQIHNNILGFMQQSDSEDEDAKRISLVKRAFDEEYNYWLNLSDDDDSIIVQGDDFR